MSVELRALGKYWGELRDGRFLEVRRQDDRIAIFDLAETARVGHPVLVRMNTKEMSSDSGQTKGGP